MAAMALGDPDPLGPRKRSPVTLGRVAALGGVALAGFVIWSFMSAQIVTQRPNEMKATTVILPPPPVPPPPPKEEEIVPPEPAIAPPLDQPVDTPPPDQPQQSNEPAPGDSALTAREGAGPSNYGLAVGNGSGTRIGGRPGGGGDGWAAYGELARREVNAMIQRGGREISRSGFNIQLGVAVDPASGRVTGVRVLRGSGDARRDAAVQRFLTGQQLSQRPPAGLPLIKLEINGRSGA